MADDPNKAAAPAPENQQAVPDRGMDDLNMDLLSDGESETLAEPRPEDVEDTPAGADGGEDPNAGNAEDDAAAAAAQADIPDATVIADPEGAQRAHNLAQLQQENQAITGEISKLEEQFRAGDIEDDEYWPELEKLRSRQGEIQPGLVQLQAQEQLATERFNTVATAYLNKFSDLASPDHFEKFNAHVRSVTGSAAYAQMPFWQQLKVAHSRYAGEAAVLGISVPPVEDAPPAGEAERNPSVAEDTNAETPKNDPPRTLAAMPQSDAADIGAHDSTFQALQRLEERGDVEAYERAYAQLPAADRERYLQWNPDG